MTQTQKIIKYCAIAFAVFLIFLIISGIASIIGTIGNVLNDNDVTENITELNLNTKANILEIDLKATNLIIKKGSELKADTNNENITIKRNDNKLVIREKSHLVLNQKNNADLTVFIPDNINFNAVSINGGAGKIKIEELKSENLFLDLGAGNVTIENLLIERKAEIDGGFGNLTINNGQINNLELDLGVGDLSLTSYLTGEAEINTGVGESNINLLGDAESYSIEVDKGIGDIIIDGVKVNDEYVYGKGLNFLDIDGGIGNIKVNFNKN